MIITSSAKGLFYKLFSGTVVLGIAIISACAFVSYSIIDKAYIKNVQMTLSDSADFVSKLLSENMPKEELHRICQSYSKNAGIRTTIVGSKGEVLLDTDFDEANMSNHSARREISSAFFGERKFTTRYSGTLNKQMMYIAVPAGEKVDGQYRYCVRQSIPISNINDVENVILGEIAVFMAIALVFAFALSYMLARKISSPIRQLTDIASKLAKENFEVAIPSYDIAEVQTLAKTFDDMAKVIRDKIRSLKKRNLELDEIFANMDESVFICSKNGRVRRFNRSCAELFNIDKDIESLVAEAAFRNSAILAAIDKVFESGACETEICIDSDKTYQFVGNVLPYESKTPRALIVMRDISMQKKNESLRKEFVASVSHELKTPITSIKIAAETVLESCEVGDKQAVHFLEVILRESERMNLLVNDMLLLSRIEFNQMFGTETFEKVELKPLISEAVAIYEAEGKKRGDEITVKCPDGLCVNGSYTLLQMAVGNLISNAISHAGDGVKIEIEAAAKGDGGALITVADNGKGIPPEDLPRVFERFYRVDKGRARNSGGTGLGLAIVKHIAMLHGGSASAQSELGKGTKFTISL